MKAPAAELPELNPEQKEVARRFGITEADYARGYLAGLYGQDRMVARGVKLGEAVESILASFGPDYQVTSVISEMTKGRWVVRIQTSKQVLNVAVDRELADDVIDSDTVQDRERLRLLLLSSLRLVGER